MLEIFDNELFHFGGDEVNVNCWNSTAEIQHYLKRHSRDPTKPESFTWLWNKFQQRGTKYKVGQLSSFTEFTITVLMFQFFIQQL